MISACHHTVHAVLTTVIIYCIFGLKVISCDKNKPTVAPVNVDGSKSSSPDLTATSGSGYGPSSMYGSGALPNPNRGLPQMFGGVLPMQHSLQQPPAYPGGVQRGMYPGAVHGHGHGHGQYSGHRAGNPYSTRVQLPHPYERYPYDPRIPPFANGRIPLPIPMYPIYDHGRSGPSSRAGIPMRNGGSMYEDPSVGVGGQRGSIYEDPSGGLSPSGRGSGVYGNGHLRQLGGVPVSYGSGAMPGMGDGEDGDGEDGDGDVPDKSAVRVKEGVAVPNECGEDCKVGEYNCLVSCLCIPAKWQCDDQVDCDAEEDEQLCDEGEDDACLLADGNFRCARTGKCINNDWVCDGDDDCGDFSDEKHCGFEVNCTSEEFKCDNGLCVLNSWRCDGENDCKDYSDELNCTRKTSCTNNEFQCTDGSCISLTWKCDSEPDCSDGSDEEGCPEDAAPSCLQGEFQCAYPRCVRQEFRCDGDDDCGDWSDEDGCPKVGGNCGAGEYKCNGGKCIPDRWRCDEEKDCDAGDDEVNCTEKKPRTCGGDEFTCSTGNCILKSWVCDGVQDCSRGEDEEKCESTCEETQFKCGIGGNSSSRGPTVCINRKHVCDGKKDCHKGEDEKNCPRKKECEANTKCHQSCVTMPDGSDACSCNSGFALNSDKHSCHDVNECLFETDPVCSQTCNNTIGSFTCGCMTGYVLRPDGRTCKAMGAAPTLLFANRVDIRQVSMNNAKYTPLLKGLHNAIALDYHYKLGLIYWSDVSMDIIRRASLNGTGAVDVIRWGLESPGGVAIDWIHDTIFWTDSGTRRVEVATLDGNYRSIIASSDLDKPRAIAVHPGEALVFWTDWGPNPKIERSEMDGSNRRALVTESLFWPNGLCIDYTLSRIYWADAKHHVIESSKFDGTDRKRVISKGLPHPFALTLFEDAIYWTDWHTKSIATANKVTGTGFKTIHSGLHFPMDIHSYHQQRQPTYNNRCGANKGGCSHMCLPNRRTYQCVCPIGLKLLADKRNCASTPDKLLLFARKKDVRIRQLDKGPDNSVDMVVPVNNIRSAVALAWDSDTTSIFWTDVEADTINTAHLNGSNETVIINSNLESPAGLALDWVTKKLYWTDAGTSHIEVSNLDGSMRALLVWDGLDKPRDIVVDPIGGFMYWSDWGTEAKIEKAGMDGSQRGPLITHNLTWPNGLAIDHERGRLYWTDGGTKAIEYANLDGTGRVVLIGTELLHPFGLAVFEDKIYWSDWDTLSIHVADKLTGGNRTVLRSGISGLMDVRVFHHGRLPVPTMCSAQNGGCSHLCLLAPLPKAHACACPIGIKLLEDGLTCANGPTNSLIFAHRVDIRQISFDMPYVVDVVLPLPPLKNAIAVDVDRTTGEIYWTDTSEDLIRKATPDGRVIQNVIVDGLETADGLVVDSTGRKIYWTDAGRNSIEVAELDGRNRKVLVYTNLESPRAITLHYHHGLMYWSDWGKAPRIEQADMDGKNRVVLISEGLGWPNGLAIDRPANRLYWNDGKRKTIESCSLLGKERRVILTQVPHPYGLVIVGSHMYWTDWSTEALHRADKINGSDNMSVKGHLEGLMDIRSIQADNIFENACANENGGCSHLCLRNPHGYSCACPTGINIEKDLKTCNDLPTNYLLLATRNSLARVSLDTPELWDVTVPIPDVHSAIAVDFHWKKRRIFYTDVHLDVIRSVDMYNISNSKAIVSTNLTTPDGLAVDWIADNIYWTDAGRKVLEVAKIDGTCRKILVHDYLDEPRALAIFPRKGYLYWTNWGTLPKIERSMLDGSSRRVIVGTELGFPNGLALDYGARRLYWADALKDLIETSDLNGQKREKLVVDKHPFGLTQFGDHIYWTDWYKKCVERADKTTGRDHITIRTDLDGVMEIRAVAEERQTGWTPCAVNNGGCTHLCLFRKENYVCACPDDLDDTPCSLVPSSVVPIRPDEDPVDSDDVDTINHDRDQDLYENRASSEVGSYMIIIIMLVLSLVFLGALVLVVVVMCHRKKREKKYLYATRMSVLTFSNPNYNASTSDVGPNGAPTDKRPFLWKRLKYDKAQERVTNVNDEKGAVSSPEAVSLIPAVSSTNPSSPGEALTPERLVTPPSTLHEHDQLDSVSLKAG